MRTKESLHRHAFTLVEIMIVVAIIGLLAAIAIPSFARARAKAQETVCTKNLRAIDGAKQMWAAEQRRIGTDVPGDDDLFGSSRYITTKPACPGSGTYAIGAVDTKASCSATGHTY
jgi:prepilin-type N-terminal cleavage/methylation domain-containing protein